MSGTLSNSPHTLNASTVGGRSISFCQTSEYLWRKVSHFPCQPRASPIGAGSGTISRNMTCLDDGNKASRYSVSFVVEAGAYCISRSFCNLGSGGQSHVWVCSLIPQGVMSVIVPNCVNIVTNLAILMLSAPSSFCYHTIHSSGCQVRSYMVRIGRRSILRVPIMFGQLLHVNSYQ